MIKNQKDSIKMPKRKLAFTLLTILGVIFTFAFLVMEDLFLAIIGILFSFVAAYNTTCGDRK